MSSDLLESFKARYSFGLDPFQLDAIRAIQDDKSVIVSAPTGSGERWSRVAIHATLARGAHRLHDPLKRCQPELRRLLPAVRPDHVGILTGDVRSTRASVVVMTTEILRNMFYTGGLDGLEFVVLDGCHYMGDGAGTVWEEIIVNAPGTSRWWAFPRRSEHRRDRRLDQPRAPPDRPHHAPASQRAAQTSWPISRDPRLRRGSERLGAPPRPGARAADGAGVCRRVVDPTVMLDELETRGWLPPSTSSSARRLQADDGTVLAGKPT